QCGPADGGLRPDARAQRADGDQRRRCELMDIAQWLADGARIPIGSWVKDFIDLLTTYAGWFFDFLASAITSICDVATWLFTAPPAWAIMIALAVIALLAKGWQLAIGTVLGLVLIITVGQWNNAMLTLALTVVAVFVATVIAIPLGIWAARSQTVSNIVRPILDFLQTMP